MNPDPEKVKCALRERFPLADFTKYLSLGRDAFAVIRRELPLCRETDVPQVLANVLYDMVDHHEGDDADYADQVIMFLCFAWRTGSTSEFQSKRISGEYPRHWVETDPTYFDLFTPDQAEVVILWLKLAKTWRTFEFRLFQRMIDTAITVWADRFRVERSENGSGIAPRSLQV